MNSKVNMLIFVHTEGIMDQVGSMEEDIFWNFEGCSLDNLWKPTKVCISLAEFILYYTVLNLEHF